MACGDPHDMRDTAPAAGRRRNALRLGSAAAALSLVTACAADDPATGSPGVDTDATETLELTLTSDDSSATVGPLCVGDIPEDLTACPDAPQNLGQVQLDETRKATLQVPQSLVTGGYRVRVNGSPPPGLEGVLEEKVQQIRIPVEAVRAPEETVLTVEALSSFEHPKAVWQFLLADPAAPSG